MLFIAWLVNSLLFLAALFLVFYGLLFIVSSWFALVPIAMGIGLFLASYGAGRLIKRRALGSQGEAGLGRR